MSFFCFLICMFYISYTRGENMDFRKKIGVVVDAGHGGIG